MNKIYGANILKFRLSKRVNSSVLEEVLSGANLIFSRQYASIAFTGRTGKRIKLKGPPQGHKKSNNNNNNYSTPNCSSQTFVEREED